MAIYKELAITKDHDKNDEVIPMDVDRVKSKKNKKKGKVQERTQAAIPKASRRGKVMATMPTRTSRAKASSRKGKMARAKKAKEKARPEKRLQEVRKVVFVEEGTPEKPTQSNQLAKRLLRLTVTALLADSALSLATETTVSSASQRMSHSSNQKDCLGERRQEVRHWSKS